MRKVNQEWQPSINQSYQSAIDFSIIEDNRRSFLFILQMNSGILYLPGPCGRFCASLSSNHLSISFKRLEVKAQGKMQKMSEFSLYRSFIDNNNGASSSSSIVASTISSQNGELCIPYKTSTFEKKLIVRCLGISEPEGLLFLSSEVICSEICLLFMLGVFI